MERTAHAEALAFLLPRHIVQARNVLGRRADGWRVSEAFPLNPKLSLSLSRLAPPP